MRKKYLLTLLLAFFSYLSAIAAVSLEEAKAKVKEYVESTLNLKSSVIYYNTTNETQVELFRRKPIVPSVSSWFFFVDQMPNAGWSHPVKVIFVSKKNGAISCVSSDMPFLKQDSWEPLNPSITPLRKNLPNANASSNGLTYNNRFLKPHQFTKTTTTSPNSYAVIISGGINKRNNYIRYWNDCALIYQLLVDVYGFSKDKIYVLMADGGKNEDNTNKGSYDYPSYTTAPTDLDGDGNNDIQYAARKNNISTVFTTLSQRMTSNDNLFVFTTDHGDQYDGLCLWHYDSDSYDNPNQYMTPSQFETELNKIKNRKTISVLMAQCFSGAFAKAVHLDNSTICTAANECEWSWGSSDYDDFAYHFTMALSKTLGTVDKDKDLNISFKEAFDYAKANDRFVVSGTWYDGIHYYEHPQYWSDGCLGERQYLDGPLVDTKTLCCTLSYNALRKATSRITSTTKITKAKVDYQTYGNIILKSGFKVSDGAKFKGTILACRSSNTSNTLRSADINLEYDDEEFEIDPEITDIDDAVSEVGGIEIYPNPTDGLLYINSSSTINKVIVADMTGKIIMDVNGGSDKVELDLSSNPKGIYVLKVISEDDSIVEKIVLE